MIVQYVVGYAYDTNGRLAGLTYPSGRTLTYSFDTLGRVAAISTTGNGQTQQVVSSVRLPPLRRGERLHARQRPGVHA